MKNDEWLTPPDLVAALGPFDLDPCSPGARRPWDTARVHFGLCSYGPPADGLALPWFGRVWLNPPYGREADAWLAKLVSHGDGVALIFARTETEMFFKQVWEQADAVLFLRGRLHFHYVDGRRADANGGAPSVLIAYGPNNVAALRRISHRGQFVPLDRHEGVFA